MGRQNLPWAFWLWHNMGNWFLVHFDWRMDIVFEFAVPLCILLCWSLCISLLLVLNILQTGGKSTEQEAFPLDIKDVLVLRPKQRHINCLSKGGTT